MSSSIDPETRADGLPQNDVHGAPAESREGLAKKIAFFAGGFGVLSGFAIFFLMLEKADEPLLFLGVLGVASVLSAIFEWLREQIDHPHAEHHGQRSIARFFVFFVVLAVAEFHVMSWEAFTVISASHERDTVISSVIGTSVLDTPAAGSDDNWRVRRVYLDLAFLLGFWVLAGAVLSVTLLAQLKASEGSLWQRMFRGGRVGAFTGALVAPLCLLGYVLIVWLGRGLYLILFDPVTWRANLAALRDLASGGHSWIHMVFTLVFSGMLRVAALFGDHRFGPAAVVLIAFIVVVLLARSEKFGAAFFLAAGGAAVVMAPLFSNLASMLGLLLRAALVWVVPGIVLGAMSPLLRETSEEQKPKMWALVAFACAVVLFVITLLRFEQSWWLLLPAGLFAAMGFTLRRASRADEYWLPMAVSVGVLVWGAMLGVQSASSFAGVYDSMHQITTLPSELSPARALPKSKVFTHLESSVKRLQTQMPDLRDVLMGSATPEMRLQKAREIAAALEVVEAKFRDAEANVATVNAETLHPGIAECEKDAEHLLHPKTDAGHGHEPEMKRFEHMTFLIKTHRHLFALMKHVGAVRAPLQELREKVAAIAPPAARLNDFLLGPGESRESAQSQEVALVEGRIRHARQALLARIDGSLATLDDARKHIGSIEAPIAIAEREMRDTVIRWLELALAGSVGYWTAVSLLVGWAMQRKAAA